MPDDPRDRPFGRHTNGRANGHEPEGMGTDPVPLDDLREPLDLVAVQADDELINALSAGFAVSAPGVHGYDADDHVAAMLAAWKADVDSEPIPQIDLDTAVDAVLAGSRPAARRPSTRIRHLVPVASAAALVVVAITGVSIAAHDTRPGDALFPISKVLYAEEARSYEALDVVHHSRERAREALAHGDKESAEVALAEGQEAAESVLAEHGRGEVEQKLHKLKVVVDDSEQGVPTVVEEDRDTSSRGSGSSGSSSQSPDPSEGSSSAAPESSETAEPTEPTEPDAQGSGDPSDRPGTEEPDPSSSETSQPPPTTSGPDPRSADAPPPGQGEQTSGSPSSEPAGPPPPPKKPTEAEPSTHTSSSTPSSTSPSSPPQAGGPAPTTNQAPETTSGDPTKRPTTAHSSRTRPHGSGISGASMSATGTATPSGEPTS
ncbi:MAG: anti-sigma-D factor RsdA [Pseudonocardia sp.]